MREAERTTIPVPVAEPPSRGDFSDGAVHQPLVEWRAESLRAQDSFLQILIVVQSLRRSWRQILLAGTCLALVADTIVWKTVHEQYAATALIHFASEPTDPLGRSGRVSPEAFTAYKSTMTQLVKSSTFLKAVAERSEVAELPGVQSANDPASYLKGNLQVEFPDRGEVMQLTAKDAEPEHALIIVNAATQVLLGGSVDPDRDRRVAEVEALEKMEREVGKQLNEVRQGLTRAMQTREGASANSTLRKQQTALQTLAALDRELLQQELELRLAASKRDSAGTADEKLEASELEQRIEADPIASKLRQDLDQLRLAQSHDRALATPAVAEQSERRRLAVSAPVEQRLNQRVEEISSRRRMQREAAIREIQNRVAIITAQQKQLEVLLSDVAQNSGALVDLDRRKADVQRLEKLLDELLIEKERAKLAVDEMPRTTLLDGAELPKSDVNATIRRTMLSAAGLASFLFPAMLVAVWGCHVRYVYGKSDIEEETGIPVLGTLPDVPPRIIRRIDRECKGHNHLRNRLKESVDLIVNSLGERLGGVNQKTLLVCSSAQEEGKTLFARHLAVNLAQLGYRTLAVDCDLRRPRLHRAFHVPLTKGTSEILRGELTAWDALQHGPVKNLWVTTAGTWDEQTRVALHRGRIEELLDEYRALFQTIILVGAPLLPVVDTRLIVPQTDGIILSAKRDVSRVADLTAAKRLLDKLNKTVVGAALTGEASTGHW